MELDSEKYGESILALMKLARGDTGGSKVAAQVLLSSYNGDAFHLCIPDLCNLDRLNYKHAMTVIHGRVSLMSEPQNYLTDGDKLFTEIWEGWKEGLHIEQRFKTICSA